MEGGGGGGGMEGGCVVISVKRNMEELGNGLLHWQEKPSA